MTAEEFNQTLLNTCEACREDERAKLQPKIEKLTVENCELRELLRQWLDLPQYPDLVNRTREAMR